VGRQNTLHDENKVQTRVTRSKVATTEITTTTALPSKLGNNMGATRKRAALGDVTNAHKKTVLGEKRALGDVNAKPMDKKDVVTKRPVSRKPSTLVSKQESKPLASKQASSLSVVVPKKRPSEAVRTTETTTRRPLSQSTSTSSLALKSRVASRRRAEDVEPEVPRKKQKVEVKQDWDDLDAVDANDPLMVSEYVVEIFDYMRELEVYPPTPH
jgi:G2/mitotic-specific cyclin 1/2